MRSWWLWVDNRSLEVVLVLAFVLVGVVGAVRPVLGVAGLVAVDSRVVEVGGVTQVPGGGSGAVSLRGTRQAEMVFADPDLWERALLVLPGLARAVLVLVILGLLGQMARSFRKGDAFVPQNSGRLWGVAVAVLLVATLVPALDAITTEFLISGTPVEGAVVVGLHLSGLWGLVALFVAAAAGAFRHGARLRADTEGLV